MKFLDLTEEVLAQRERDGVRGLDRELSRYRCHIEPACFSPKDVTEIGAPDIREWLRSMQEKRALGAGPSRKLSRQTINRCQSLVSAVFNEAVDRELIETNPCQGVKAKKRVDESDTREKWAYLTPAEQQLIIECPDIPIEAKLPIRFAIGTGLRQGEQRHLELADIVVDGPDPHVTVRYAGRRKGKKLPPKSGKIRVVPLFGDGLAAAREWLAFLPTFCPNNPEGLAFPTSKGKLRYQGKFLGKSDTLRGYYRAAGIELRPHLHWHALRHTFATNLVTGAHGPPWRLELVQVAMGHSSITITQRYAHVGEDALKAAARAMAMATVEVVVSAPQPTKAESPSTLAKVVSFGRRIAERVTTRVAA